MGEQHFMRTIPNDNRYLSSSFINIRNIAIVYHLFYRTCNALPLCFTPIGNNNNEKTNNKPRACPHFKNGNKNEINCSQTRKIAQIISRY